MRYNSLRLGACILGLALSINVTSAQSPNSVKAGTLDCDIAGGIGMIIASDKSVTCRFEPGAPGWLAESYRGSIQKLGVDLGATTRGRMIWAVFAAGSPAPGALAGDYTGATAEATFAVGLGANVLIGGSNRSIALQPVSATGQEGLNVAGGIAVLRLTPYR